MKVLNSVFDQIDLIGILALILALVVLRKNRHLKNTVQSLVLEVDTLKKQREVSDKQADDKSEAAPDAEAINDNADATGPWSRAQDETVRGIHTSIEPESLRKSAQATGKDSAAEQVMDAESTIGGKISIWVGGLALAMGGLFLVRYAIENSILGPTARVFLGFVFGFTLVTTGEWMRRRPERFSVPGFERANIPAMLSGSGIFIMFGAIFAAHAFYDLIGATLTFIILALLSFGAMLSALLHGPILAALGLFAAFTVPFLISSSEPNIAALAIYVILISSGALAVARMRGWLWFALSTIAMMMLYAILIEFLAEGKSLIVVRLYEMVIFALGLITFVMSVYDRRLNANDRVDWLATITLSILTIPAVLHFSEPEGLMVQTVEMVLLLIVPIAVAAFYPALRYIVVLPAFLACLRYASADIPDEFVLQDLVQALDLEHNSPPLELVRQLTAFAAIGVLTIITLLTGTSYVALRTSARTQIVSVAGATALAIVVILFLRTNILAPSYQFAFCGVLLSFAFQAQAAFLDKRLPVEELGRDGTIAASLIASLIAFAVAVAMYFEGAVLTIVLGLVPAAAVFVSKRYTLQPLRIFAVLSVVPYVLRILWQPLIAPKELVTALPLLNDLLWGYGLPAVGLIFAAIVLSNQRKDWVAEAMQAAAIIVCVVGTALLALHAINPTFSFAERNEALAGAATLVMVGGAFSLGLTRITRRQNARVLAFAADTLGALGIGLGGWLLFIAYNPLHDGVGLSNQVGPIDVGDGLLFNLIGYAYGLPMLLYIANGWFGRERRNEVFTRIIVGFAIALGFFWINLTIRQHFSPGMLNALPVGQTEQYTYSIIWLTIGVTTLFAGIGLTSYPLRIASGIIMVLVILKVFIFDLSNLTGVLRALSFIGLGLVLMGIGFIYQRALRKKYDTTGSRDGKEA